MIRTGCTHPDEYLAIAEAWGPLGPLTRVIRCRLCGDTLRRI